VPGPIRAIIHGNGGNLGARGNLESVTCRPYSALKYPNPSLSPPDSPPQNTQAPSAKFPRSVRFPFRGPRKRRKPSTEPASWYGPKIARPRPSR
jgi:hypothetical protein